MAAPQKSKTEEVLRKSRRNGLKRITWRGKGNRDRCCKKSVHTIERRGGFRKRADHRSEGLSSLRNLRMKRMRRGIAQVEGGGNWGNGFSDKKGRAYKQKKQGREKDCPGVKWS